jgi:hypothetical protein
MRTWKKGQHKNLANFWAFLELKFLLIFDKISFKFISIILNSAIKKQTNWKKITRCPQFSCWLLQSFWKTKKSIVNDSIIDLFAQTNNINIYWLFSQKKKFNKVNGMFVLLPLGPFNAQTRHFASYVQNIMALIYKFLMHAMYTQSNRQCCVDRTHFVRYNMYIRIASEIFSVQRTQT